ncbi:lac repressor [Rubripirellula lacrimiformis]|uniref:Lac repressor n=2 Tax=Rubripirellula lacrimiformis TaxID=1930273 RepID=A0A517NF18_9BACT|nr:lac repressor [Rubripirellula lacrimiformis]
MIRKSWKRCIRKNGVAGVIHANDRVAATLLQALAKTGWRVPRQLRLVGFDDVKYASFFFDAASKQSRRAGFLAIDSLHRT